MELDAVPSAPGDEDAPPRDDALRRRRAGLWSIALTLLIGAVIAGTLAVVQLGHQRDVAAADRAARLAGLELQVVRARAVRELAASGAGRPSELAAIARRQSRLVPQAPPVPAYGAQHSDAYRALVQDQRDLTSSLEHLASVARSAAPVVRLLDAADAALAVRPTSLAPFGLQSDGSALRATVVAGMSGVLDQFRAVPVPKGHEQVARSVESALSHVITEASALADRLDRGSGGSFAYATEYASALQAVEDDRTRVSGDLQEALDAVIGTTELAPGPDSGPGTPAPGPTTAAPGQDV